MRRTLQPLAVAAQRLGIRTEHDDRRELLAPAGVGAAGGAGAGRGVGSSSKQWAIVIPVEAWTGGIASAVLVGAFAGLTPAVRAARLPPTVALRTA